MKKIAVSLITFVAFAVACTKGDLVIESPAAPIVPFETPKTLQLPATAYHYADIPLPQHILENVIEGLDQTRCPKPLRNLSEV